MPRTGAAAPDFALPSTSGETVKLRALRGKKVVLYFYPKDDTPGCTREACDFRDNLGRLAHGGAVVLGVSGDSQASHAKFRGKHGLPFELLSDPRHTVAKKYGAWGEKTLYGRKITGTIRSTFLIDERGRIAASWSPVKVDGHVDQVLAQLNGSVDPAIPAPRKRSAQHRIFAQPKQHRAGKRTARAASARASQLGRGYRSPSRVKGHASRRGAVK